MSAYHDQDFDPIYPQKPHYQATSQSTLAIASLILGIVGLSAVPIFGSIAAIVTGHLAIGEIRKSGGRIEGEGMAKAGLILGYIPIVIGLIVILLIAVVAVIAILTNWR